MEVLALKVAIVVALMVWQIASVALWRDEYHCRDFSFRSISAAVFVGFCIGLVAFLLMFMTAAAIAFVIWG